MTDYTYDPNTLRLTHLETKDKNQITLQDLSYAFDAVGNVLAIADNRNSASQTFTYDALNRLTGASGTYYGNKAYAYDAIGNMILKDGVNYYYGAGAAGPHAVTSASDGSIFTYDANGNMLKITRGGVIQQCQYDRENRLTTFSKSGKTQAAFVYDGDGGRTRKTAYTYSGTTTTTTPTNYVGSLFEKTNSVITRHLFLGGQRIASVTGNNINYYHPDHLGSSNIITDQNGIAVQHLQYEPYGAVALSEGQNKTDYKFTGKELDEETGLYFFGARYYNPAIGRWLTPDSTVQHPDDPQDLNRYTYCRNNPINLTDPSGLGWKSFWKRWGGFFGAFTKAVFTGDWKSFGNTMITTATAFIFSGFNPIVASAVYLTESTLDTEPGWRVQEGVAKGLFDNVFGMRSRTAYIWSAVTLRIAVNLGFETMLANMSADPSAGKRGYDPNNPTDKALTDNPEGYYPFGRYPGRQGNVARFTDNQLTTLVGKNQQALAVVGKDIKSGGLGRLGLKPWHTGAIARDFSETGIKAIAPDWMYASLFGTCHQATNATLLAGGLSDTVMSLYPHWSTFASTAIYGNYGGGLVRSTVSGIQAYQGYRSDKND